MFRFGSETSQRAKDVPRISRDRCSHLLRTFPDCDPSGLLHLLTDCISVSSSWTAPYDDLQQVYEAPPVTPLARGRFFRNTVVMTTARDEGTQTLLTTATTDIP